MNRAVVDRDANWLVHMDVEAAQKSSLQAVLLAALDEEDRAKLEECRQRFGIMPGDIKGMTVYGGSFSDEGVAVLTTTGNADQLAVKLPGAGLEGFAARIEGNTHYFSFKHEAQAFHAAVRPAGVPDERFVLIAGSAANLEKGLKVVKGLAPNLMMEPQPGNLLANAQPDKASLVFVAARDIGSDPQAKANFLRNARGLVIDLGETIEFPREMFATVSLTANNAKIAEEMKQTCVGLVALGKMFAREHKAEPLVESLDAVEVTVEAERLSIVARERSDSVIVKLGQLKTFMDRENGRAAVKVVADQYADPKAAPKGHEPAIKGP